MFNKKLLLLAAMGVAFAPSAWAADATNSLTVDATVSTECIVSAGAIHFGAYAPITAASDSAADGAFTVACTKGTAVHVGMGQGANYSSGRRMKNGTENYLAYALYKEVGHSNAWTDTESADRVAIASTAGIAGDEKTVFGLMTKSQDMPAGAYTDTVAINVWLD